MDKEIATFGGGCFWQIEESYRTVKGVMKTSVGYMGGHFPNPSYLDVLSRITGHAEVAQIEFAPDIISYEKLLDLFWSIHDPTQLNRQGADRGEQYRSIIFYHNQQQAQEAKLSKLKLEHTNKFTKPIAQRHSGAVIVTLIEPASEYYLADESHQQYIFKSKIQKTRR